MATESESDEEKNVRILHRLVLSIKACKTYLCTVLWCRRRWSWFATNNQFMQNISLEIPVSWLVWMDHSDTSLLCGRWKISNLYARIIHSTNTTRWNISETENKAF